MPTPLLRNLGVDIAAKPADYLTTDPDIKALEDGFYSAAKPVFGLYQRVVLRLGEEHEVAKSYLALQMAWLAMA